MKIDREMLKQALLGSASCNAIALSRGISHNTVRRALRLLTEAGVTVKKIDHMTDTALKKILYPGRKVFAQIHPEWEQEIAYLELGHTNMEAHARYEFEVGSQNSIAYSTYCDLLIKFRKSQAVELRHRHQPGYMLQIDPAGYRPEGIENNVLRKFVLLVAVLPASGFYGARVIRSQSTSDIIESVISILEAIGGVPETIRSDNLKAVVVGHKANRDPIINTAFLQFADYYNMRVTPARVYKPKDKGSVENAVKHVQRHLKVRLRKQPPRDLAGINHILNEIIDGLNEKNLKRRKENRNQRLERIDRPYLKPLPAERIEFINPAEKRLVPPHHHVAFDKAGYSVPYHLVDKIVWVRASSKSVEIRYDGQIVAIHDRIYAEGDSVTMDEHSPQNHQTFTLMRFNGWKKHLSTEAEQIVDNEVERATIYLNRNKIMARVRRLLKDYGDVRFDTACKRAVLNGSLSLNHVTNLLINNLENKVVQFKPKLEPKISPQKNVRGSKYFDRDIRKKGGES